MKATPSVTLRNGAAALVKTLVRSGVDTCFANPGTSELHFMAAMDETPQMRCVPCLFEGVATGAADGYGRMLGRPAATLLHLGPGLGNGHANLHNARKARSPIINIIGDHATYHRQYDAPLTSDIESQAKTVSDWVRTTKDAQSVAVDGAQAVAAARTGAGRIATLILPADAAWNPAEGVAEPVAPPAPVPPAAADVDRCAKALKSGKPSLLFLGGRALHGRALRLAGQIAARTGAAIISENQNARVELGAGRVPLQRLPYAITPAVAALAGFANIILVHSKVPVAFFANPGKPSLLVNESTAVWKLSDPDQDAEAALEQLADALGALATPAPTAEHQPVQPASGAITLDAMTQSLAALIPAGAIVVDEAAASGRAFVPAMRNAAPVDWLNVRGGSIGFGLPSATGAALACPDRKVVCLQADGSGMYTLQALWTMAREALDVTIVLFANRSYATLVTELANVGIRTLGPQARDTLQLERPEINWLGLARDLGVDGARAETMEAFNEAFCRGLATPGPYLVEVMLPIPAIP